MRAFKADGLLTTVLVLCALVTTGLVIRREINPAPLVSSTNVSSPSLIKDWREALKRGSTMGPPNAPVQVVEFADFECPFCASFNSTLRAARERYQDKIALTFAHFPLETHKFAESAALAAECAADQGHFEAMHNQLFEHQSAFGQRPWTDFARDAGVADLSRFEACMAQAAPLTRIRAAKALGANTFEVRGTPTVVINGWKLSSLPSDSELDEMIQAVLAGESPIRKKPWWSIE